MTRRSSAAIPPSRLAALRRRLLAWWSAGHRDLPWRFPTGAGDPYRVWLSEVMLQQTRVEAVVPYYRRFVERWPTLEALAASPDAEVFAAWSGLGYYARCRNLLACARTALARHGGLPASLAQLGALPGFGPYTAGAVASIAFGIPAAAVDGNVARVLARVFALRGNPAAARHRERLWALARALVGESAAGGPARPGAPEPGDWNQALMELGATVCGRSPACERCPLASLCAAHGAGLTRAIPARRRRGRRTQLALACAVIERRGRVLLVRRPARGLFAGLLAFPGAELPPDCVAPAHMLQRALRAQGLRVRPGRELACVNRVLTHRDLQIRAFSCDLLGPLPAGEADGGSLRWIAASELRAAGMPSAMNALLPLAFSARVV